MGTPVSAELIQGYPDTCLVVAARAMPCLGGAGDYFFHRARSSRLCGLAGPVYLGFCRSVDGSCCYYFLLDLGENFLWAPYYSTTEVGTYCTRCLWYGVKLLD